MLHPLTTAALHKLKLRSLPSTHLFTKKSQTQWPCHKRLQTGAGTYIFEDILEFYPPLLWTHGQSSEMAKYNEVTMVTVNPT